MIEIAWGAEGSPLVAVIGKGVVFDTGGLDIKPSSGMRLMKKDMGGAAHALALGRMVMALGLKVRLHVLVPVVENAISGDAMRPGDVIASRKGLSIEIGNTDAEGRLILADALARAAELNPVLTIDMATLTGAARVALGPQVIPLFHRRRRPGRRDRAGFRGGRRPPVASAPVGWIRRGRRQRHRRPQERSGRLGPGRFDHRRPVPQALRPTRKLGPSRHLRLEFQGPPRLRPGRRGPGIRALLRVLRKRYP